MKTAIKFALILLLNACVYTTEYGWWGRKKDDDKLNETIFNGNNVSYCENVSNWNKKTPGILTCKMQNNSTCYILTQGYKSFTGISCVK